MVIRPHFSYVKFQLSKKLKTGKGVKTIKIPSKDKTLKSKTKCQVAGWGQTEQENVVNDLLVTDVSPINSSTCQTMWKKVKVNLPNNVLCAGGYETKSGACQVHLKQYFGESSYSVSLYSSDLNKNVSGINLKCIVIAG